MTLDDKIDRVLDASRELQDALSELEHQPEFELISDMMTTHLYGKAIQLGEQILRHMLDLMDQVPIDKSEEVC